MSGAGTGSAGANAGRTDSDEDEDEEESNRDRHTEARAAGTANQQTLLVQLQRGQAKGRECSSDICRTQGLRTTSDVIWASGL